jgi:hypothetical protein
LPCARGVGFGASLGLSVDPFSLVSELVESPLRDGLRAAPFAVPLPPFCVDSGRLAGGVFDVPGLAVDPGLVVPGLVVPFALPLRGPASDFGLPSVTTLRWLSSFIDPTMCGSRRYIHSCWPIRKSDETIK